MVQRQRFLLSTNKVEAMHLRTLRAIPKSKTMKNTYHARCFSAVLKSSLGLKASQEHVAKKLGYKIDGISQQTLHCLQRRSEYHAARQKSYCFRKNRFLMNCAKTKIAGLKKLSNAAAHNVNDDHKLYTRD